MDPGRARPDEEPESYFGGWSPEEREEHRLTGITGLIQEAAALEMEDASPSWTIGPDIVRVERLL